jgi:hypothetical protein
MLHSIVVPALNESKVVAMMLERRPSRDPFAVDDPEAAVSLASSSRSCQPLVGVRA